MIDSIKAARRSTCGSSEKGQTRAGAAKTRSSEISPSKRAASVPAISARGQACARSPAPTALPTRTPAAEPKPIDRAKAILWIESIAWKAAAASLPSRVESTIRVEKRAGSLQGAPQRGAAEVAHPPLRRLRQPPDDQDHRERPQPGDGRGGQRRPDRTERRQPEMAADPGPGEQAVERQHDQIDGHHPARAADPLEEIRGGAEQQLGGEAQRHGLDDIGARPLQRRLDSEQAEQAVGEEAEDERAGETDEQGEDEAGAEDVARLCEAPAAVRARGEDQHAGQAGKAHDEDDEGDDPARPERRQFRSAVMADHGDIDQMHQGPVEAGQHDRPGQAQDTPGLGSPFVCPVVLHRARR